VADNFGTTLSSPRFLKKVQLCSRLRTIPQDSGIGFSEGEPVRARGIYALSQRENCNHPREIDFSFHRAGTGIGQKGMFFKGLFSK